MMERVQRSSRKHRMSTYVCGSERACLCACACVYALLLVTVLYTVVFVASASWILVSGVGVLMMAGIFPWFNVACVRSNT